MMTAKAQGKNRVVRFRDDDAERPGAVRGELRSLAHMKLLQSLTARLNRLNDVSRVGEVIAEELHALIDYHNCRVFIVEGNDVVPIAFRGDLAAAAPASLDVLRVQVGEGVTGHVAATGRTVVLGDAAVSELAVPVPGTQQIAESVIAAPLLYGSQVTGVLVVSKLGLDQFDDDDARLVEVLCGHASIALENARLYEARRREAESATALLEFGRALAGSRTLDEALSLMVAESAAVLGSAHTSVWVQDAATLELVGRAEHRKDGGPLEATQTRYSAELAKRFFSDDAPFAISRAQLETLDGVPPVDADYAVAPFVLDDGRRGCLVAALPADRRYDERDLRLLGGLAHQARLAIGNVGGNRHLENAFVATLERVAATLGVLVPDAASGREVADVALAVGRDLGLDDQALRRLELAALFRDVGNIGVPAAVLEKPDRLAAAERRLVERHVELGEQVVEPVESLREVARLVRHSHERWDGAGYPDGLAGEAIPLESRIVHVCDAFHAITSERPYRGRLPVDEALRRLEAGAGTQFDPAVVLRAVRLVRAGRI
jgi:GAF domain-containing protein